MASPFRTEIKDPLERVKAAWEAPWPNITYDRPLREHIHPHSATVHSDSTGILSTTIFLLDVAPTLLNGGGNLHGGASATILDLCTSIAIAPVSTPGFWRFAGVSRTLNVSYLKPVPGGLRVAVGCEILSLGKRGAVLRGWIREWDEKEQAAKGDLLVVCEHGKANVDHLYSGVKI